MPMIVNLISQLLLEAHCLYHVLTMNSALFAFHNIFPS